MIFTLGTVFAQNKRVFVSYNVHMEKAGGVVTETSSADSELVQQAESQFNESIS